MELDVHKTNVALSIILADCMEKLTKSRNDCDFLLREMMCEYKTEVWNNGSFVGLFIIFSYWNKCTDIYTNTYDTARPTVLITQASEKISDDTDISYKDDGTTNINFEYRDAFVYITIIYGNKTRSKSYLSFASANSLIKEIDNYLANQPE